MSTLTWSEGLELGLSFMDDTHREFVDLLAQCEGAADAELPALWDTLIAHTADHFGREDEWMLATGFASGNCHATQHKVVLQVLREGALHARQGDLGPVRQMIGELAAWFPQHAKSMDAALALHLRGVGFDAATGAVHAPQRLPATAISGCGGGSCG
ncbi:hemerythrin domain-containing protein [Ramlibacter pallidus]|uniref:Hemerythrin domain-containing protein n=1 Tax=Ramlibacter pallidus TaxID=2780087 RepID=A0ABR9S9J6_9BURK|nr:hemerythrin domain-containing protein [Ramlibacter pallidus]MBE7370079.1 hemerythrin domain-containing protein [Ramlibacter pallidus]